MADPSSPDSSLETSLDLVQRAKAGDRRALEALFARYQDRLRRIVRLQLGSEIRGLLESMDIVQETLLVAHRRLADFEPRSHGSILRWMVQIARHKIGDAVDHHTGQKRDHRRTASLEHAADSGPGIQPHSRERAPSEALREAEAAQILDECVRELSPRHRDAIIWREHGLHTYEELAEHLGCPTAHAAEELHRRASKELLAKLERRLGAGG